ncbi:MAG: valine--tRNA ligase [Fimbriimonadales bacterium]|nr:valine--tRNA ligase [Fimbriimonadales bacterium]
MPETTLPTRYDAAEIEPKWYRAWEEAGLFQPKNDDSLPKFCITIPPPNITGSLHMGHALCYPIQDALGRFHRLLGHDVLILPGQDHAGIATQSVVAKNLRREGVNPAQLGRERFVERVWEWRRQSGDAILAQFRRLGCAFDWTRLRFTLDEGYARAVLQVFVDWFDRGLIYRGKRVVNWDPVLETSVSDIETERRLVRGKLYYVRYPFEDGSGHVTVATTRPETMLADVAVAVHPSDKRYAGLVGKTLVLPLLGRRIPLLADPYPDPAFGTGAVKITPAHDPNDYEVGLRHGLPMPVLLDSKARITAEGGPYAGLDRYEARKRVVADLEAQGLLEKTEDYDIPILVSERSGEPIEPLLSEEWFAKQSALAGPAAEAVRSGRVRFIPERYNQVYLDWLENLRDWNVSRRLWWGHRIPVYYTEDGEAVAALSWDEAERKAGRRIVRQDEDVLDTWFSSGLWPFATLGWPDDTEDLRRWYPTTTMVTDRNIIYLWVARMVMMGLDFLGREPFRDVYIHATVLTEDGRRMSKSLGTGVDPMGVIERVGADALRYTLLSQTGSNQEIRYSERRNDDSRNFCSKIWNATRFVLMHCDGPVGRPASLQKVDRWILSRLAATEREVREAYQGFDLQRGCQALYRFFWSDFADWYIEVSKGRLSTEEADTPRWVLLTVLEAFLTMLHPIMPHLTEELYSHLPLAQKAPFLMASAWPQPEPSWLDPELEAEVERWFEVTRSARALRAELDLAPLRTIPELYVDGDLGEGAEIVRSQAWFARLHQGPPPAGTRCIGSTVAGVDIHLPIAGLVDEAKERERLAKEEERLLADLERCEARLSNPQFVERAKPEVVEKERRTQRELQAGLAKVRERRRLFGC